MVAPIVTLLMVASSMADQARSLAVGRINEDRRVDLVIAGPGEHITVMTGQKDGAFDLLTHVETRLDRPTGAVAIGSVNKDEHADIVASTPRSHLVTTGAKDGTTLLLPRQSGGFAIFRGGGDGAFDRSVFHHDFVVAKYGKFALDDVNGDRMDDIIGGLRYAYFSDGNGYFDAHKLLTNTQLQGRNWGDE
jgi:hypothetical protein